MTQKAVEEDDWLGRPLGSTSKRPPGTHAVCKESWGEVTGVERLAKVWSGPLGRGRAEKDYSLDG